MKLGLVVPANQFVPSFLFSFLLRLVRKREVVTLMLKSLLGIDPTNRLRKARKKLEKPPISPKSVTASFTKRSAI